MVNNNSNSKSNSKNVDSLGNNGDENNRRILATSSTDCVLSDDGIETNPSNNYNNNHQHNFNNLDNNFNNNFNNISFSSMNENHGDHDVNDGNESEEVIHDDGASLYVNAQTEVTTTQTAIATAAAKIPNKKSLRKNINGSGNGPGKGVASGLVFRGLSKSASMLLSQDRQTLSELLNVDILQRDQENDDDGIVDLGVGSGTAGAGGAAVSGDVAEEDSGGKVKQSVPDVESQLGMGERSNRNTMNTGNQGYIYRIRELEERCQQQEETIIVLQNEWEEKMKEQKIALEQKYQSQIDDLQKEISKINVKNKDDTKKKMAMKMSELSAVDIKDDEIVCPRTNKQKSDTLKELVAELTPDQISRYSRQLLLNDGFGVNGQKRLLSSSVLVIGAGGIGSTVLLYLAASGVGKIVIVDFDAVEKSNLHRQVIHCEANVGKNKAMSACEAIKSLNPSIDCIPIQQMFTYDNALDIISKYDCDCIVDACDNPQTRYICNDASILTQKPLISGSAMGTEGQLTVYGMGNSACYRCLYPKVNPSEGCKSCSDNGVLGTVPGLIGILQATETLKVLTGVGRIMHDRLLMYDSMGCTFMNVKKPPRRKNCIICSPNADISMQDCKELSSKARGPQQNKIKVSTSVLTSSISPEMNVACIDYEQIRRKEVPHLLLDVRVKRQYDMCSLSGAVNIELGRIVSDFDSIKTLCGDGKPIYCICRRGIASTEATRLISEKITSKVYNIVGGYNAWAQEVDCTFPTY